MLNRKLAMHETELNILVSKSKKVTEEFPQCDDKDFHALLNIGWFEIGELPPDAADAGASNEGAKRKPKSKEGY